VPAQLRKFLKCASSQSIIFNILAQLAAYQGPEDILRLKGRPPNVSLVATVGITPPITFGQGSDPEILGVVTVGVHHLVD
jgi:hypothetical protein